MGAMKGEILKRAPEARIVDLCHEIEPGNIEQGAFVLGCAIDSMPEGTVFCCVVDPGVGTARGRSAGGLGSGFMRGRIMAERRSY